MLVVLICKGLDDRGCIGSTSFCVGCTGLDDSGCIV